VYDTEWADGPRRLSDGSPSDNYSSTNEYEYFAQTGCAFQGTNNGTDPYTGRPRNNGRSWVTANDPGLASLLSKVCSTAELRDVNPREARARALATPAPAPAPAPAPGGATPAPSGATPAPAPVPTPGSAPTPTVGSLAPAGAQVGSGAVGAIVGR